MLFVTLWVATVTKEDEWFGDIDNQVFSFKTNIKCWLKDSEENNMSKNLSRSSRSSASNTPRESKSSTEPKLSKEIGNEDKIRVPELVEEAELLEQKQIIECEAQKLKIREELAKARARVSTYDEAKLINFEEVIIHKASR